MSLIRIPENDIVSNPLHSKPFLTWIQEQVDNISKFADVIEQLKEEQGRRAIVPHKVYECAAKFTEFYTKNIAFQKVYEEFRDKYKKEVDAIHDEMYLDIKKMVTDYSTDIGMKYKKKDATQAEIERELRNHFKYAEYIKLTELMSDYDKKAQTQEDFIKGLGKLDQILGLLQRASNVEFKYLYLEK
jgi:hypothetical protein